MAPPTLFLLILLVTATATATTTTTTTTTSTSFAQRRLMKLELKEKLTLLHFYFHDIASGPNATTVPITPPSKLHAAAATSAFGMVTIMDDLLTSGPEADSPPVGRAQGFYAATAQAEMVFLMAMNLAFTEGKYDGSVLTVLGRYPAFQPTREMPVVGGSGVFRLARGYALARTHALDVKTGDAVVEYDVTVVHY